MSLAINGQTSGAKIKTEDINKLLELGERYTLLLKVQKLTFNLWLLLLFVKTYKWFLKLKLGWLLEKTYRKYGDNTLFRSAMEGVFSRIYEETKDSCSEGEFIDFISSLGLTRKVKELLKEDAEEAVDTYKLKQECEKNKERLEAAFLKLQEKLNGLSTV
jgi:hypothetical protein